MREGGALSMAFNCRTATGEVLPAGRYRPGWPRLAFLPPVFLFLRKTPPKLAATLRSEARCHAFKFDG